MEPQTFDGRLIYLECIWDEMRDIGTILCYLGYYEHSRKPNLFCKSFGTGILFADLRGREGDPLWKVLPLRIYSLNIPMWLFISELIILKRCKLTICEFTSNFRNEKYHYYLPRIPTGYCKACHRDFLSEIPWYQLDKYPLDLTVELFYCNKCKLEVYMRRYRRKKEESLKKKLNYTCHLCGSIFPQLYRHHITYNPEKIIKVCPQCHGYIHKCTFPFYLWKQKRPVVPKQKKVRCLYCKGNHFVSSKIFRIHQLYDSFLYLYSKEFDLKAEFARIPLEDVRLQNKYFRKIERIQKLQNAILKNLNKKHQKELTRLKQDQKPRIEPKVCMNHNILEYL